MASSARVEAADGADAGRVPALADFRRGGGELFDKCSRFRGFTQQLKRDGCFQAQYRVVLEGPLDHVIRVRDPFSGAVREMLCFDSNSYLGLHLDPRVSAAVRRVLDVTGYGTPSAQVLGGTNRWLRELEDTISAFHGREDTHRVPHAATARTSGRSPGCWAPTTWSRSTGSATPASTTAAAGRVRASAASTRTSTSPASTACWRATRPRPRAGSW